MLRTKKKQLNLKPNRFLDKRTSRGMLYENEELRLRTIHINDEVDKGQTDIKKLRKENEYLKREIWSLRDECEKLEDVIKKVYAGDPPPADQLPKYQPRVRKMSTFSGKWDGSAGGGRRGSGMSFSNYSFYDENESEDNREDPEMDEDDLQSYDESISYNNRTAPPSPQTKNNPLKNMLMKQDSQDYDYQHPDDSSLDSQVYIISTAEPDVTSAEGLENLQKIGYFPPPPPHHHQHWQMHAPELEAVTEETESGHTSVNLTEVNVEVEVDRLNHPMSDIRFIDSRATSVNSELSPGELSRANGIYNINGSSMIDHGNPYAEELIRNSSSNGYPPEPEAGFSSHPYMSDNGMAGYNSNSDSTPNSDNSYTLTPFFNPTIEITPASSPTPTNKKSSEESGTSNCENNNSRSSSTTLANDEERLPSSSSSSFPSAEVQDLGCVTLIPKTYQVTSELKILPDDEDDQRLLPAQCVSSPPSSLSQTEGEHEKQQTTGSIFGTGASSSPYFLTAPRPDDNPPSSASVSPRASPDIETSYTRSYPRSPGPTPSSASVKLNNQIPEPPSLRLSSPGSSSGSKAFKTLSFVSDSLGKSNPKLVPLYQSEPSLNSLQYLEDAIQQQQQQSQHHPDQVPREIGFNLDYLGFHGFDQSVEMCSRVTNSTDYLHNNNNNINNNNNNNSISAQGWNSVDKNLIIGYLDDNNSTGTVWSDLTAQEIIDELEAQFDPTLEKIAGVRMLTLPGLPPRRVFISMRTAVNLKLLLERGFTLRGNRLRLQDASQTAAGSTLVVLSGIPASFPDSLIISVLNQFGQVVAPLERRIYKGVDISERLARMHLVRNFPPSPLSIAGCQVAAKIVTQAGLENSALIPTSSAGGSPSHSFAQAAAPSGGISPEPPPAPQKPGRAALGFVNFRPTPHLRPSSFSGPSTTQHSPTSSPSTAIPRPHKLVARSATLESSLPSPAGSLTPGGSFQLGPTAAAVNRRKMSICSAVMDGSAAIPPSSPAAQKQALLGNPKKPLSRLPRSSPGSLTPSTGHPVEAFVPVDSPGMKPLLRSMSFEPRKMSNLSKRASTDGSQLSLPDSGSGYPGGGGPGGIQRQRYYQQQGPMTNSNSGNFRGLDKKESLPWCGCWGNGCI